MRSLPLFLLALIPAALAAIDTSDLFGKTDNDILTELYSRDSEALPGPIAWGHKFMGGGAGEGTQFLSPEGLFPNKQEVKSDNVLPAYCDPPNPCPKGYTAADGCMEEFENTADFSRAYQARQNCLCDEEHMFSCPSNHHHAQDQVPEEVIEFNEALEQLLGKSNVDQHKTLVAKKFHAKRGAPRRKRMTDAEAEEYFYQMRQGESSPREGDKLIRVAKKGKL